MTERQWNTFLTWAKQMYKADDEEIGRAFTEARLSPDRSQITISQACKALTDYNVRKNISKN